MVDRKCCVPYKEKSELKKKMIIYNIVSHSKYRQKVYESISLILSLSNAVEPAYIQPAYHELMCKSNSCKILLNIFSIYKIIYVWNFLCIQLFVIPIRFDICGFDCFELTLWACANRCRQCLLYLYTTFLFFSRFCVPLSQTDYNVGLYS